MDKTMNVCVARQPIFDENMSVYAYELLYRSEEGLHDPSKDGAFQTGEVIFNTLVCMGLEQVLDGKKAFVNFTKETIMNELPRLFSTEVLIVELLEDIVPDDKFIECCQALRSSGYSLALDDFVSAYPYEDMVEMVQIIKVDFKLNTVKQQREIIDKYNQTPVKFLAEKIETQEEYETAKAMGFHYFQGFFFSKPVLVSGDDVKVFPSTIVFVLRELSEEEPSYDKLEEYLKHDFSMTFKLLKLVNSPAFYSRNRILSIRHALTMLGFKEIRKIFALMLVRDVGRDQPRELIRLSLIRGRMCENVAKASQLKNRGPEAFLLGLFSAIDRVMNKTMEDVIKDLPLQEDLIDALLSRKSIFLPLLFLVKQYEKGDFLGARTLTKHLGVSFKHVQDSYIEALNWTSLLEKNG
jgi:EAL and modified HD-GYP domain-containing signal transduction protein